MRYFECWTNKQTESNLRENKNLVFFIEESDHNYYTTDKMEEEKHEGAKCSASLSTDFFLNSYI